MCHSGNRTLDRSLVERRKSEEQSWRSWPYRVARERWHIQSRQPQSIAANAIVGRLWEHARQVHASTRNRKTQWQAEAGNLFQEVALALGVLFAATSQVSIEGAAF